MSDIVRQVNSHSIDEHDYKFVHDLRLITANDVYRPERFASMRTLVKQYRDDKTKVILPGDLLGASRFSMSHLGEPVIDLLNHVGVDYCTLGNHEFDFGHERLEELMQMSRFQWLGSNVRYSKTHPTRANGDLFCNTVDMDEFNIEAVNAGEIKVGVFGLCTASTPLLSTPGEGVVFEDVFEHAKRCVDELKNIRGCELILAFTHLSVGQDKELCEKVPGINVILGGHDHDPYFLNHRNCLIIKCGQNIDHLGILDLVIEKDVDSGLIHVEHTFQLLSTKYVTPNKELLHIMEKWKDISTLKKHDDDEIVCSIATNDIPLSSKTQSLRAHENSFGCLVADAIKWSFEHGLHITDGDDTVGHSDAGADGGGASRVEGLKCDIAIQNGGFIRGDKSYLPGSSLTTEMIREEMPFNRAPFVLRMKGDMLKLGIEEMLKDAPNAAGSFPHFSAGTSIIYDPTLPPLHKIKTFKINNELVDDDKDYLVGISQNYIDKPCDNVHSFHVTSSRVHVIEKMDLLIREVVVKYLKYLNKPFDASLPGRLIDCNKHH